MKDKFRKLLCIFLILISLTGCVKYDATMTINKDRSMSYGFIYAVDKKLAPKPLLTDDIINRYQEAGYHVSNYDDGNYVGYRFNVVIGDIDSVSSLNGEEFDLLYIDPDDTASFNKNNKPTLFKKKVDYDGSIYTANFAFDLNKTSFGSIKEIIEKAEENNITSDFENNNISPFVFKLTVTIPNRILGTNNATKIAGQTLIWELSDFINKPEETTNDYWKYRPDGEGSYLVTNTTTTTSNIAEQVGDSIAGVVMAKKTTKATTTSTTTSTTTTTTTKPMEEFTNEKEDDTDTSYRRNIYFSFDIPDNSLNMYFIALGVLFVLLIFSGFITTIRIRRKQRAIKKGRESKTLKGKGKKNKALKGKLIIPEQVPETPVVPVAPVPVQPVQPVAPVAPTPSIQDQAFTAAPLTAEQLATIPKPEVKEEHDVLSGELQMTAFGGGPTVVTPVETPVQPVAPEVPAAPVQAVTPAVPVAEPVAPVVQAAPVVTPVQPEVTTVAPVASVTPTPIAEPVPQPVVTPVVQTSVVSVPAPQPIPEPELEELEVLGDVQPQPTPVVQPVQTVTINTNVNNSQDINNNN